MKVHFIAVLMYLSSFNTIKFGDSSLITDEKIEKSLSNLTDLIIVED